MNPTEDRPRPPIRRRADGATPTPEEVAPAASAVPVAPAAVAPVAPRPRPAVDLEELAAAATMDRRELDALMAAFAPKERATTWRRGQRVHARVSRVTGDLVFLDVGGKADAAIDRAEVGDTVAVGDTIDCFVLSLKDGELRLTKTIGGDATREMLDEARENNIPVQGKVTGHNEHGFEVQLSGGVRGFCPMGQIDREIDPDPTTYVGRSLSFRILDVRGREAIVSHRAIAEEEARSEQGRRVAEIKEGEVYGGVVTGLRDFGAFVRLPNGAEGLVHLSNIGKARLHHPKEALTEGQEVTVRVLSVDLPRQRLNLGIRQAQDAGPAPEAKVDRAQLSAGTNNFGTLAGLLGGVRVSQKKKTR